jgi:ubiquinone biosynthesis protein COQ4
MIRPVFSISATRRIARISRPTLQPYRLFSNSDQPFYGSPRPPKNNQQRLPHQKLALAIHHATTAFSDPTRADAVAALGELTGQVSLERIHQKMMADPTGQRILQDRPMVSKATIPYEQLIQNIPDNPDELLTFGQAYGKFLKSHGFDPDERDPVKYIEDETLAYIMLRYRQVRSFFSC